MHVGVDILGQKYHVKSLEIFIEIQMQLYRERDPIVQREEPSTAKAVNSNAH